MPQPDVFSNELYRKLNANNSQYILDKLNLMNILKTMIKWDYPMYVRVVQHT